MGNSLVASGCLAIAVATSACGRVNFDPLSSGDGGGTSDGGPQNVRSQLTLTAPTETLTDFPLLVVLNDARAARNTMQADASDLRFYDSSGTVLPHEIEELGTPGGGPLYAWVRVPTITGASTTIGIDYGHGAPGPASTLPVWSATYAGVYHLNGNLRDSTPREIDGTWFSSGGTQSFIFGPAALAQNFRPATNEAVVIPDNAAFALDNATTISAWAYPRTLSSPSGYSAMLTRELGTGTGEDFWIGLENATSRGFAELGTAGGANQGGNGGPVMINTSHHVLMTYDGAIERLYVDGTQVRMTSVAGGAMLHSASPIVIGADRNNGTNPNSDFFDGGIDEVRVETVVRTPGWIAYDVASMRDQVITYGAVGP